jgi:HEAT repeat protein
VLPRILPALLLLAAVPARAVERAEALIYVLQVVDVGGVVVPAIVPEARPGLSDSGPGSRPQKAFEALRARSPKAYGATSLRINSATSATIVLDKVADADQVLAEVYWTLASMGFTEVQVPPPGGGAQVAITPDKLAFVAHMTLVPIWDLLAFHENPALLERAFVMLGGGQLGGGQQSSTVQPAADALRKLQKGDPALKRALNDVLAGAALRPKLAVLDAIADGATRDAFKLKAEDAALALTDQSLMVRSAALDAVIAAGFAQAKSVLSALEAMVEGDADQEIKLRAVRALAKAGVTKYADLLEAEKLKTGSAAEALLAVEKLATSSQPKIAAPALVGALSHSDAAVRDAAFQGLVALKEWDLLHRALDSDQLSAKMREEVARVLTESGSATAQDQALQYLLQKSSAQGAVFAAQTLGKRGAKTATPQLIDALKHESPEVRQAAADGLAALKDERAIVPLADAAASKARDREIMMTAAQQILATLRLEQVMKLVESKNTDVQQIAIRALAEFAKGSRPNPAVVAALQQAKSSSDIAIKRAAVYALARLQDDGIARDLAALRSDSDADVRQQVAQALGNASAKFTDADKMLDELVNDRDKRVRIEALSGLAKRKVVAALPKLLPLVRQPDPDVRLAVFQAIYAMREGGTEELRAVFRKGMEVQDSKLRLVCLGALAEKTTKEDIESVRQAQFDKSKDVKLAAIALLGTAKLVEGMDVLANFWGDDDKEVVERALDALGGIPAGESKKQKVRYLQDLIDTDPPQKLKDKAVGYQKAA